MLKFPYYGIFICFLQGTLIEKATQDGFILELIVSVPFLLTVSIPFIIKQGRSAFVMYSEYLKEGMGN